MAGNYISIGSQFNPLSFQDLMTPLQMYTTEYNDIQTKEAALNAQAGELSKVINEKEAPTSFAAYQNYQNDLRNISSSLAQSGLTPDSRQKLLDMSARYNTEITPIQVGYNAKVAASKWEQDMKAQNPSVVFNNPASTTSLDAFVADPSLKSQFISGKDIRAEAAQTAAPLAHQIMQDVARGGAAAARWQNELGGQYYEKITHTGFTDKDINDLMSGRGPKVLQDIVASSVANSGVMNWNNPAALKYATREAIEGVTSSIGETKDTTLENRGYLNALQRASLQASLPQEPAEPLYYNTIPDTQNVKSINQYKSDLNFLNTLSKNPSKLSSTKPGWGGIPSNIGISGRLNKLLSTYGINPQSKTSISELRQAIGNQISASTPRTNTYNLNVADPTLAANRILSRINVHASTNEEGHTGVYEMANGKKTNTEISGDKLLDYISPNNTTSIFFKPGVGLGMSTIIKGKSRSVYIDPESLTGQLLTTPQGAIIPDQKGNPQNYYRALMNQHNYYLSKGDITSANAMTNQLFSDLYYYANTGLPSESTTSAKIQPDLSGVTGIVPKAKRVTTRTRTTTQKTY